MKYDTLQTKMFSDPKCVSILGLMDIYMSNGQGIELPTESTGD